MTINSESNLSPIDLIAEIKLLHPEAKIPEQSTEGSAGMDCYATEIIQKEPDLVIVKLGFAISFPKNYRLMFTPRSSLTKTKWIMQNSPGIGDSDYRGEYEIRFRALLNDVWAPHLGSSLSCDLKYPHFPYSKGDKVIQMYFAPVLNCSILKVDELTETERGEGGFGSTDKK